MCSHPPKSPGFLSFPTTSPGSLSPLQRLLLSEGYTAVMLILVLVNYFCLAMTIPTKGVERPSELHRLQHCRTGANFQKMFTSLCCILYTLIRFVFAKRNKIFLPDHSPTPIGRMMKCKMTHNIVWLSCSRGHPTMTGFGCHIFDPGGVSGESSTL